MINLVPYHAARIRAVGPDHSIEVCALQIRPGDPFAALKYESEIGVQLQTAVRNEDVNSPLRVRLGVRKALEMLRPDVVCVNGWGAIPGSAAILEYALERRIPVVLLSESSEHDLPRHFLREWIKTRIVSSSSSALVGGSAHLAYLIKLGMDQKRVFLGYDVVDNVHFEEGVRKIRADEDKVREDLGLPRRYFLSVARLEAKKNLSSALRAFAGYCRQAIYPWHYVIVGDGELSAKLTSEVHELGIKDRVLFTGAKNYEELLPYFGLAACFIHPSTTEQWGLVVNEAIASGLPVLVSNRCGCVTELVKERSNGLTFDPYSIESIQECLVEASASVDRAKKWGRASQELALHWGPERFASGLTAAVRLAYAQPATRGRWLGRVAAGCLSRLG